MRMSGIFPALAAAIAAALPISPALSQPAPTPPVVAGIVSAGFPGEDAELAKLLSASLQKAGYSVEHVTAERLGTPQGLRGVDLLVLPDAAAMPISWASPIQKYLRSGGDILALKAPLWQQGLVRTDGRWIDRAEAGALTAGQPPEHIAVDLRTNSLRDWKRSSSNFAPGVSYAVEDAPDAPLGKALHTRISNLESWETFNSPELTRPFASGDTLTVFSAKGDARTSQLAVEWIEKDGSRWIAVAGLTQQWRRYVLAPSDFHYWQSTEGRGGPQDQLHPENATHVSVGLAFSHTGTVGGKHEYWVSSIGTAPLTDDYRDMIATAQPPELDTLSPGYKLFDVHQAASLAVRKDQAVVEAAALPMPRLLRSPQPRPSVTGFGKGRDWRFLPVVEARSATGEWRGTPVTLTVNCGGPYMGGLWASFGIDDAPWYKNASVQSTLAQLASRMRDGVFLIEAGADCFTYFQNQDVTVGLRAYNASREQRRSLSAKAEVKEIGSGRLVFSKQWAFAIAPGAEQVFSQTWTPAPFSPRGYACTVELLEEGRIIDRASHEIHVWTPSAKKDFVKVKDGGLFLGGKRWRACGVNYMPSSGIGTEDGGYFENWLGHRSYDPEIIERDIRHIKQMGLNAVSIFVYQEAVRDQNLLDLLRRLREHGLKANLSLRPIQGLRFDPSVAKSIIDYYRLRDNDTVFAYDIDWEPMFNGHSDRQAWDTEWEQWITERYGSIQAAEKDWGFPVPRDKDGRITNPLPQQIDTDGPWRTMVAAYRRFLDTLLYKRYSTARDYIRSIDPNHLVSFRMAEAGNPTFRWDGRIPYDFPYLGAAVDILEPEGYGRISDKWEWVKPGWFEYEYARSAAPSRPVIWAEMGVSAWDMGTMQSTPEKLVYQAAYYTQFFKMLRLSRADGVFSWWYPGGFRVGENSDFGIINPDGTDRPVTQVIRNQAKLFLQTPPAPRPDTFIQIDRDAHADGVAGIYDAAKQQFWKLIAQGKHPGLRTAGTDKTSADCLLQAVGNVPSTGANPLKYLDGVFDSVQVRSGLGHWQSPEKDGTAIVEPGQKTLAQVTVTNLAEAQWLAPERHAKAQKGRVYVMVSAPGTSENSLTPLPANVDRHASITVKDIPLPTPEAGQSVPVTISLVSEGRCPFGEKYTFILQGPAR